MPLDVVSFCTYRTSGSAWRRADHDAHDFVQILKGNAIREYSWLKVRGEWKRFDNTAQVLVLRWFGQMAADYLRCSGLKLPFGIVPIPSCTRLADHGPSATARMATALAQELGTGATVDDALRFKAPMLPSRCGGTRSTHAIYQNLRVVRAIGRESVILVDDAVVTGSHIRAAAARLLDHGVTAVLAVCAARCELDVVPEPFAVRTRRVEDFTLGTRIGAPVARMFADAEL